jgi:hypothetical protein
VSIGAQTGETTDVTTVETGETTAGTVATEPTGARAALDCGRVPEQQVVDTTSRDRQRD